MPTHIITSYGKSDQRSHEHHINTSLKAYVHTNQIKKSITFDLARKHNAYLQNTKQNAYEYHIGIILKSQQIHNKFIHTIRIQS